MLEIKNIKKSFGGVCAVNGSNFVVEKNRITALIGPNGAGKTTLFDIIAGFVIPDKGKILLNGKNISGLLPYERANLGISRTFQQVRLFRYLTILDHLLLSEGNEDTKIFKSIFSRKFVDREKYQKIVNDFGIDRPITALVSELSYGQKKLLQILMCLSKPHSLVMLDEPVAGVNKVIQERIEKLLIELKLKGETVLLIDHDMDFIRRISDTVIALDAGVVVAQGTATEVLSNLQVIESYLGK